MVIITTATGTTTVAYSHHEITSLTLAAAAAAVLVEVVLVALVEAAQVMTMLCELWWRRVDVVVETPKTKPDTKLVTNCRIFPHNSKWGWLMP